MRAVYCNSMVTHALYILDTGAFTTIDVVIVFTYSAVNWRNLAVLITSHSYKAADWFASHCEHNVFSVIKLHPSTTSAGSYFKKQVQ